MPPTADSGIRPYVAIGGGMKHYRGTGEEQPFQPLSNIAILTKTNDTKGMVSVGGGVKVQLTRPYVASPGRPRLPHAIPEERNNSRQRFCR